MPSDPASPRSAESREPTATLRAASLAALVAEVCARPGCAINGRHWHRRPAPEARGRETLREAAQAVIDQWVTTFGPDGYTSEMPETLRRLRAALTDKPSESDHD